MPRGDGLYMARGLGAYLIDGNVLQSFTGTPHLLFLTIVETHKIACTFNLPISTGDTIRQVSRFTTTPIATPFRNVLSHFERIF
jgi:hypothetical protein